MSDAEVRAELEILETWARQPDMPADPAFLAEWNRRFQAAAATAERGAGWEALVARAHRLAGEVTARQAGLEARRDAVRAELEFQAQGTRALRGYGAGLR